MNIDLLLDGQTWWVLPIWECLHQHNGLWNGWAQSIIEGKCPFLSDGLLLLGSRLQPFHFPFSGAVFYWAGSGNNLYGIRSAASHLWNNWSNFPSRPVKLPVELMSRRLHEGSLRMLAHSSKISQFCASWGCRRSLCSWPNRPTQVVHVVFAVERTEKCEEQPLQQSEGTEFSHVSQ